VKVDEIAVITNVKVFWSVFFFFFIERFVSLSILMLRIKLNLDL